MLIKQSESGNEGYIPFNAVGRKSPVISARIMISAPRQSVSRCVLDRPGSAHASASLSFNDVPASLRFGAPELCV
jgi:hypothetical protein